MSTERRELVHQLQATVSKMEVALGLIADAVVFLDEGSQVQWCNSAFEQLVNRFTFGGSTMLTHSTSRF
jgi:hypothetical protein